MIKEKEEFAKKLSTSENEINVLKSQLKSKEIECIQVFTEKEKISAHLQAIKDIINDFLKNFELETLIKKAEMTEYANFLERNLKIIQNSFSLKNEDVKNLNNTVNIVKIIILNLHTLYFIR